MSSDIAARPRAARPAIGALFVVALLLLEGAWPAEQRGFPACPVATAESAVVGEFDEGEAGRTLHVVCAGPERAPLRGPARLLFGQQLDLVRAPAAWLEVLPGIGPSRAAAIVEARRAEPFTHVGDLTRVVGIGAHTAARVAPWLRVGDAPDNDAARPRPLGGK